jgi:hypothetical protein
VSPGNPVAPTPAITELTGFVVLGESNDGTARTIGLRLQDGAQIALVGSEANPMASVDGAEVRVRGTFDAAPGLVVESFTVISVGGRPALDGIVTEMAESYGLLLRDGTIYALVAPPAELLEHLGERVWLTGDWDAPPIEFGVIPQS